MRPNSNNNLPAIYLLQKKLKNKPKTLSSVKTPKTF